jgi:hypothetical protein
LAIVKPDGFYATGKPGKIAKKRPIDQSERKSIYLLYMRSLFAYNVHMAGPSPDAFVEFVEFDRPLTIREDIR